jgi:hypothetical protein
MAKQVLAVREVLGNSRSPGRVILGQLVGRPLGVGVGFLGDLCGLWFW